MADVANETTQAPVKINQDANIFVSEIDAEFSVSFDLGPSRQAYLLCIEGSVVVDPLLFPKVLKQHSAAKLFGPSVMNFRAGSDGAHILLVEMLQDAP